MPLRDVLIGLTVALLWGLNFVVMKVGVAEIPPFLLAALRFGLGAVPAIFFLPRPRGEAWRWVMVFGLAFGVVKFGLLFSAFKFGLPAGLGALLLQLQAPITIVLAVAVLGERVSGWQVAGAAVALAGLGLLAIEKAGGATLLPFLMVLAAAAAWAVANIATRRSGTVDPLTLTVWGSAVATLPLLLLSGVFEGGGAIAAAWNGLTWTGVGAVLYLAYPVNILGIVLWSTLLRRHGAAAVSPFSLLVPIIAMAAAAVALQEPIGLLQIAGGALILGGLGLGLMGGARRLQ
jgi:O-acetylserine/cysteine efflux transporter